MQAAFCAPLGARLGRASCLNPAKGIDATSAGADRRWALASGRGKSWLRVPRGVQMGLDADTLSAVSNVVLTAATEATNAESLPAWLPVAQFLAGPVIYVFNTVMLVRIPLSWYPKTEAQPPWIYLVALTEPLLKATRKVVPPQGGVDVSPIIWLGLGLFLNEILIGPQGLLVLIAQK
ncbi:Protein COFACTOR ASSEMBLY OF COMPLEX C SUBUNIT B CCB3, chloroplastic [Porphyridium purpureum]|uniref:Protein COFACTOR ASSEMBLY OF COMPLEX C SUBUNIT B CCB3, chloroplastic n=1 Tax=Porphyridium purpureum TaxID=35688 RepID=A0A5J4YRT8_PORPP|nr:Protein COFACTOR ASSEMBLY OF COMPLEX C SUBUNIT B CCB3, chloroplastic [Porphyridium purpureum]|eukprot:POR4508..scf296_7